MVDAVNNFTINNTKYYESITVTASDAQGDITHNPETVIHTSKWNDTVTHTRNTNFEKKMSNWTIPVLPPAMNLGIYQGIAPIVLAPQTLLVPVTKEVVANASAAAHGIIGLRGK